jgi:hypothetical protein
VSLTVPTTIGVSALAAVNLVIAQGATFTASFRYLTGSPAAAVDLTGWTARAQLRSGKGGEIWLTLASGTEITLTSEGTIGFTLPHTATEGEVWDTRKLGVWDLELTSPAGVRLRFAEGTVTISHDVTRDA